MTSWRCSTCGPASGLRRPLTWDGRELALGPPAPHAATPGFVAGLCPGDRVSLHWDRVCDRLTVPQVRALRHYTELHLRLTGNITNGGVLS